MTSYELGPVSGNRENFRGDYSPPPLGVRGIATLGRRYLLLLLVSGAAGAGVAAYLASKEPLLYTARTVVQLTDAGGAASAAASAGDALRRLTGGAEGP